MTLFLRLHLFLWIIFCRQCLQTKDAAQYEEHASASTAQQSLAAWTAWQGSARHRSDPTPTRAHRPSPPLDWGDEDGLSDAGLWRWGSFSMGRCHDSSVEHPPPLPAVESLPLCSECLILDLRDEYLMCLFVCFIWKFEQNSIKHKLKRVFSEICTSEW